MSALEEAFEASLTAKFRIAVSLWKNLREEVDSALLRSIWKIYLDCCLFELKGE